MEREPLRESIRRDLTDRIVAGELSAGERIKLVPMAEEIGVSMTPLRESLVQLELEGFVISDPGCGYSVAEMTPAEVEEIYPLIWTLECLALRLAPPARDRIMELRELNARFRSTTSALEAERRDAEFHAGLLAGCTNRTLTSYLAQLKRRAARYEVAFMRHRRSAGSSASADQHDEALDALSRGELDAAAEVLEENWRTGPQELLPWLREDASEGDAP